MSAFTPLISVQTTNKFRNHCNVSIIAKNATELNTRILEAFVSFCTRDL